MLAELERWGWGRAWIGPDPYEAMNARASWLAPLRRTPLGRRLLIQSVKRSPLDLRRPLGIAPRHNAASIAHVASAYARLARLGIASAGERLGWAVDRLEELRSTTYPEPCWSYHFDVETRFFHYGAETPNTIATAFAALALLDAAEAGEERALETAVGAGEFILRRLTRTEAGSGAYFGYFPGDATPIHNASLLACAVLARLHAATGERRFAEPAGAGVDFALAHQRPDGSWPYAEGSQGGWVDGFHTGYVLDALLECERGLGEGRIAASRRRGLDFYAEHLFEADGTPRYFADRTHPIDGQSAAQAIRTFTLAAGHDGGGLSRAERCYRFAVERMRRGDGAFIFQRRRLWANRCPHVRWVQAPMLDALARLYEAELSTAGSKR